MQNYQAYAVEMHGFKHTDVAGFPLYRAAGTIADDLEKHILSSPNVRALVTGFSKGPGTACPDSSVDEVVKYLANRKGVIKKNDPRLNLRFVMDHVMPVAWLERDMMRFAIMDSRDSPIMVGTFDHCVKLAEAVDVFFLRWYGAAVVPWQMLGVEEQVRYKERLRSRLPKYDYTIFDLDPEQGYVNRRAWAEAFPDEVGEIVRCIGRITDAVGFHPETRRYFEAMRNAYACTDIAQLETLWATADRRWVEISNTTIIAS